MIKYNNLSIYINLGIKKVKDEINKIFIINKRKIFSCSILSKQSFFRHFIFEKIIFFKLLNLKILDFTYEIKPRNKNKSEYYNYY